MILAALLYAGVEPLLPLYDSLRPVLVAEAKVIERAEDSVTVHLVGRKSRDCRFVSINASTKSGNMFRGAQMLRVDIPGTGVSRQVGQHDFGVWRIWPLSGGSLIAIHVQYDCSGRYVLLKAVEVTL